MYGWFNLDDFGTKISQDAAGKRPSDELAHFNDAKTSEWERISGGARREATKHGVVCCCCAAALMCAVLCAELSLFSSLLDQAKPRQSTRPDSYRTDRTGQEDRTEDRINFRFPGFEDSTQRVSRQGRGHLKIWISVWEIC